MYIVVLNIAVPDVEFICETFFIHCSMCFHIENTLPSSRCEKNSEPNHHYISGRWSSRAQSMTACEISSCYETPKRFCAKHFTGKNRHTSHDSNKVTTLATHEAAPPKGIQKWKQKWNHKLQKWRKTRLKFAWPPLRPFPEWSCETQVCLRTLVRCTGRVPAQKGTILFSSPSRAFPRHKPYGTRGGI